MRLELIREDLLVQLADHYLTRGARFKPEVSSWIQNATRSQYTAELQNLPRLLITSFLVGLLRRIDFLPIFEKCE